MSAKCVQRNILPKKYDKHVKNCLGEITYKCNDYNKIDSFMEHMKKYHPHVQVIILKCKKRIINYNTSYLL